MIRRPPRSTLFPSRRSSDLLQTGDRRVRPRLGLRHGTPLASRDVPGERGRLSSCIWNLGFFPNDARKNCPFVLTSFTGGSSERCPGIGLLSRGDREIGVLRNVEPPTRPRLECLRETGLILRCDRKVGNPFQTKQRSEEHTSELQSPLNLVCRLLLEKKKKKTKKITMKT